MNRRNLLTYLQAIPFLPASRSSSAPSASAAGTARSRLGRVRPTDPAWPSGKRWERLNRDVGGRLLKVQPLLAACAEGASGSDCQDLLRNLRNPYFVGDRPAGTQAAGWVDAWMSAPSVYAVAARSTSDIVAAVNFARENRLRLVIKGGGHSYQGTSDAAGSLLIWTRAMNRVAVHDAFVAQGCAAGQAPQPAVTVGPGAVWMHVYDAVTTKAGRYVQGGGCATVGVAGLVQSGGFGSFSKNYGMAAAGLLEAEIVLADGIPCIANACINPELFWGIRGGGGGSLGVITRLTLRTHDLPVFFGGVDLTIKAASDAAFGKLMGRFISFYADRLLNPHWGESVTFGADNTFIVTMVFQGLDRQQAEAAWRPLLDWLAASPRDFTVTSPFAVHIAPARDWWNAAYLKKHRPDRVLFDHRPNAPEDDVWFAEQRTELGVFVHGYQSVWLPESLLHRAQQERSVAALFAATRYWAVALHFNKGLAGSHATEVAAARDTATHPAVLTAFALAIIAFGEPGAFAGIPGQEYDLVTARRNAAAIGKAAEALRTVVPEPGSYVAESDYFDRDWQSSCWGTNYRRLRAVKDRYDPAGLFFVHHGVGSEDWSADGFTRLT